MTLDSTTTYGDLIKEGRAEMAALEARVAELERKLMAHGEAYEAAVATLAERIRVCEMYADVPSCD
jgi:hypothetical protein